MSDPKPGRHGGYPSSYRGPLFDEPNPIDSAPRATPPDSPTAPPTITLSSDDLAKAVAEGERRMEWHKGKATKDKWAHGSLERKRTNNIEACCAELAFANHVGGAWTGRGADPKPGVPRAPDVIGPDGTRYEVRWRSKRWYDLDVHATDYDDQIAVCVTGKEGTYTIWGGMPVPDARQPKWRSHLRDKTGWLVPKQYLTRIYGPA